MTFIRATDIPAVQEFLDEIERGKLSRDGLWPLIQALERACWKRKWSEVKAARKTLEVHIGKRPHDPLFQEKP